MGVAAVSASISTPKAFNNIFATSITQRLAHPITLTPLWPPTKPNNYASNPISRNHTFPSLTCCSTKPDTNTNNGTTQNSSIGSNPSSNSQNLAAPISSNSLSSSFPSPSSSTGLVFDLGPIDSWDSKEIGSPVVKRFLSDEEERWYMWYHGNSSEKNSGLDSIGLAVSSNGIHWERGIEAVKSSGDVGLVMNCCQDWWAFDTISIRPSEVVVMSSNKVRASNAVYWLYYSGFSSEKVDFVNDDSLDFNVENPEKFCFGNENSDDGRNIFKSLPGLAISQDGRHWARIEGEHHSGALFDVGSECEWDSLFIASPQVVFHGNGDLRMYYHSFDMENGQFGIGIARSRDGIKWVKLGKIMGGGKSGSFDEFGVMNASVVKSKKDGKYVMAYEGVASDGKRSIGLAVSPDGLKDWRRFQDGEVLKPSEKDGWDNRGVGSPCLVQMEGDVDEWRLYYRGVSNEGRTGIGMAFCVGNDVSSFTRWTGFQL
ncbi:conserved hypothetical protein [Ricinus communis]|uniref:Glycosyl hydrolase, five-bladed beta-propellor domain-containing protein n=1 Tax=Ricinus communis TaxID=3988 RepID=B9S903_RICCO|nr:conserved hypothetical protein [Ricinus communis]|eukprot:XP_002522472.1 uncharacterized protein LOC8281840 [Ricinus communis]